MAKSNTKNGSKKGTNGKSVAKAPAKNGNGKPAGKGANPNKDPAMKGKPAATIVRRDTSKEVPVPEKIKPGPDPRMPAVGTKIKKLDRRGIVRCECIVKADGIFYAGKTYKSLSAAAVAAAKDLKLGGKTQNGFTFWGLSKPPWKPADALEAVGRAWERYVKATSALADTISAENWEEVHGVIKNHADQVTKMKARADKAADTYKKAA